MRIIDVIDHTNVMDDEFVYREPQMGSGDWRMGSQVIVGESQMAVFVRGGQALDGLQTGRHTLSVANIPILAGLIGLATSGKTPFTADLYFINLKDMPQVLWGTSSPIVLETPGRGLGVALLRTRGTMDLSIADPMLFLKQYGVGKPVTRVDDLKERLQTTLIGAVSDILLKSGAQSVPDANKVMDDLEGAALVKLSEKFAPLGLRIKAFEAVPFTVVEIKDVDQLRDYVSLDVWERAKRLQIAQSAAENQGAGGALAGAGVGLGVGQQIGAAMNPDAAALQQQMAQQQLMMQQMMMQMMDKNKEQSAPAAASSAAPAAPQTKEQIQAMLDNLDMKLANGEITEAVYNKMVAKWQEKLDSMK